MKIFPYLTGPIQTNVYLVLDEETKHGFVVDPGAHSSKLFQDLKENQVILDYVVLTHAHGDHIGGVQELLAHYPEAKLMAGVNEMPMMNGKLDNSSREICGRDILLTPDKLLEDGETFDCGNMTFKVIETPGHTPGGICLYSPGVLFSGDTLFRQSVGRTDFPGGDTAKLIASIKNKLFTLPEDTLVLPGHMETTDIGFEKRNNYFV